MVDMDLFADDELVAAMEAALPLWTGSQRLVGLLTLAWHLRQRDTRRALQLADLATAAIDAAPDAVPNARARLALIRAEAQWLFGEYAAADMLTADALAHFKAHGDRVGSGDAYWLMSSIGRDRGDLARRDECQEAAFGEYRCGDDPVRLNGVIARLQWFASFPRSVSIRSAELRSQLETPVALTESTPPGVAAWVCATRAHLATAAGKDGDSARYYIRAHDAMRASGQLRPAITMATNAGDKFAALNDFSSALEWGERGLDLARQCGWPVSTGSCLTYVGRSLHLVGSPAEAHDMLLEALGMLEPVSGSRIYATALSYLGDIAAALGDDAASLDWMRQCEARATILRMPEIRAVAWRGQARALSRLGKAEPARDLAAAALTEAEAQGSTSAQFEVLRNLADIHRRHELPPPQGIAPRLAVRHYLERALAVAASAEGFLPSAELFDELAAEHARAGDMAQAYALVLEAGRARDATYHREASNRAVSLQVRYETEHMRQEAAHHRELAAANAQRADYLQQANATLVQLGEVGLEITGNLDAAAVCAAIARHVQGLLDATTFAIFRLDADGVTLRLAIGIEAGAGIPPLCLSIDAQDGNVARSARERCEIVLDGIPDADAVLPGTLATHSQMFAPLVAGDRLLGVLTVQSTRDHAYAERERAILRTLCAYGAIALANAEAQAQLVEKYAEVQRLAVTDRLTGLNNRHFLDRVLQRELAVAQRAGVAFSLIIVDVDHFKAINDGYGHAAGDAVLVALAEILRGRVRDADALGRWGGEEFLVICPDTAAAGACAVAEALRASIAGYDFPGVGTRTASFGVASFAPGDTPTTLVARADRGLYAAKAGGRNRVVSGESSA